MTPKDTAAKAAYDKAYRAANSESVAARKKAYREANPEAAAAYQKAYREANREAVAAGQKAYQKAYREANREARAAQNKAYREANRDAVLARKKAYREANREAVAAGQKAWAQANPHKVRANIIKRRLQRAVATPPWNDEAKMRAIYAEAARLDALAGPAHVDHVIPLRGRLVSGLHVHTNLRVVTAFENRRKGNRLES